MYTNFADGINGVGVDDESIDLLNPSKLQQKIKNNSSKYKSKSQNNGSWEPAILDKIEDADSPTFRGVEGGVGGTTKEGYTYDKTGEKSSDRSLGFDAYEVPHKNDYEYRNSDSGKAKWKKQRIQLASERGVSPDKITDNDIYREGTRQQLIQLYNLAKRPGDADWTPGPLDFINKDTALELGSDENPLGIKVERKDSGRIDHFGRPLANARNINDKTLDTAAVGENQIEGGAVTYSLANSTDESPENGYFGNLAAGVAAGSVSTLARMGDAMIDLSASLFDDPAASSIFFDKEDFDKNNNYIGLDEWKDLAIQQKKYGYDTGKMQKKAVEITEKFRDGNILGAIATSLSVAPEFIAESLPEMLADMSPAVLINIAGRANDRMETISKNQDGVDISNSQRAAAIGSSVIETILNRFGFEFVVGKTAANKVLNQSLDKIMGAGKVTSIPITKALMKSTIKAAGAGVVEAPTEVLQTIVQKYGETYGTKAAEKLWNKEMVDELIVSGFAGLSAGSTMSAGLHIPNTMYDVSQNKSVNQAYKDKSLLNKEDADLEGLSRKVDSDMADLSVKEMKDLASDVKQADTFSNMKNEDAKDQVRHKFYKNNAQELSESSEFVKRIKENDNETYDKIRETISKAHGSKITKDSSDTDIRKALGDINVYSALINPKFESEVGNTIASAIRYKNNNDPKLFEKLTKEMNIDNLVNNINNKNVKARQKQYESFETKNEARLNSPVNTETESVKKYINQSTITSLLGKGKKDVIKEFSKYSTEVLKNIETKEPSLKSIARKIVSDRKNAERSFKLEEKSYDSFIKTEEGSKLLNTAKNGANKLYRLSALKSIVKSVSSIEPAHANEIKSIVDKSLKQNDITENQHNILMNRINKSIESGKDAPTRTKNKTERPNTNDDNKNVNNRTKNTSNKDTKGKPKEDGSTSSEDYNPKDPPKNEYEQEIHDGNEQSKGTASYDAEVEPMSEQEIEDIANKLCGA